VVLHAEDDLEGDRRHMSTSLSVPARELRAVPAVPVVPVVPEVPEVLPPPGGGPAVPVALAVPDPDEGPRDRVVATELAVCLQRRDGAPTTWVYVGDGTHQALELSTGSWRRLLPALDRVLDLARG
jgi:hypothetical protein